MRRSLRPHYPVADYRVPRSRLIVRSIALRTVNSASVTVRFGSRLCENSKSREREDDFSHHAIGVLHWKTSVSHLNSLDGDLRVACSHRCILTEGFHTASVGSRQSSKSAIGQQRKYSKAPGRRRLKVLLLHSSRPDFRSAGVQRRPSGARGYHTPAKNEVGVPRVPCMALLGFLRSRQTMMQPAPKTSKQRSLR